MSEKYIVELEEGVYLAPWDGDPGRTLDIKNASRFIREIEAVYAIMQAKEYRAFGSARILQEPK